MNPSRVKTRGEVETWLKSLGLRPTGDDTMTGRLWRIEATGRHLQIPHDTAGFYPEAIIKQIRYRLRASGVDVDPPPPGK